MIQEYSFGRMRIADRLFTRDLKIIAGQVIGDWYREGGHIVGIEDIGDILSAAPDIVVFGTGFDGQMKVTDLLEKTLSRRNIECIIHKTGQAGKAFNQLHAQGKNVAAAFHLTC